MHIFLFTSYRNVHSRSAGKHVIDTLEEAGARKVGIAVEEYWFE